ncbi:MAG TPA: dihydrodipicolinate synthase family protein [Planctomycetaceae bacterium]|nr:dihydrodipicolinate synthase family protein [Planctomycetaceae bacterium]HIQ21124.1 dihydrodipicolinate synthase family protein [Planctomycetota bacterium]
MNPDLLTAPLRGIIPPMITPLADHDTLDVAGLERLIEHILAARPSGLFILGTTGEGPSLSCKRKQELVDRVAEQLQGRVPLLVGVTDPSFVETLNLAEYAAEAGAQAVVWAPPFYYPCSQVDLLVSLERLVPRLPLPMFLYHIPRLTKVGFAPETVRRAMELPGVVGLKDSSGEMAYFHRLRRATGHRPDFSLLVGPEELLAEALLLGAHGGVSGGANLYPHLYVELYHAAQSRDLGRTLQLHEEVIRLASRVYAFGDGPAAVIQGLKGALALLGICSDTMAEPLRPLDDSRRQILWQHLEELGIPARYAPARSPRV